MSTYLSKEVLEGLEGARKRALKKKTRLRVVVGFEAYPILEFDEEQGFALDIENAPKLRGLVDLYDGSRHLYQCLIIASEAEGDLMRYDFKQITAATDKAPKDFVEAEDAPVALIESG
ncbi:MAG: hypothetical protein CR993_05530 [Rhodobacterales bacterium]|nr:MAG: hypothetical protein CR993_05530 [Rhodobacterales bacterium]